MVSQKIVIKNVSGIHARPAGILAKVAGQCKSEVIILAKDKQIQAKSILNLMAAAIKCGTEIEVQCTGETEEQDLKNVVEVIDSGLGE